MYIHERVRRTSVVAYHATNRTSSLNSRRDHTRTLSFSLFRLTFPFTLLAGQYYYCGVFLLLPAPKPPCVASADLTNSATLRQKTICDHDQARMMQPIYEDVVVRPDNADQFSEMSGPGLIPAGARGDPGYRVSPTFRSASAIAGLSRPPLIRDEVDRRDD
jgi:hypothetical protein